MKILNIKTLSISIALTTSLFASTYEYPQVYKDTKVMGMGGANIAVEGRASSLFYNTAAIFDIPKEYGWEVDIFNINISLGDNVLNFVDEIDKANDSSKSDSENTADTLDVTEKYLGRNLHLSANVAIASVIKKFDKYAFALMPISAININSKTHRGSGSTGILEINGLAYTGVALGVAKQIENRDIFDYAISDISIGLGIKMLKYKLIDANLGVAELIDDNLSDVFEEKYTKDGTSIVLDLGIKAKIYENITAGLSFQNIGSIAKDNKISKIPMTLSLGLAYKQNYNRTYFNQYQIAVDYVDLFQAYSQDKDFIKRTRIGVSGHIFDSWLGTLGLQVGLYQGHTSFGIDFANKVLKLAFATYSEELGAYSGQDADKRSMVQLSFGW